MINVHENNKIIPKGKVLLAEYGSVPSSEFSTRKTLDTRKAWGNKTVELIAKTAGWNIAGSCLRWDNGAIGVIWTSNNSTHGSWYKSHADAVEHFNRLPA